MKFLLVIFGWLAIITSFLLILVPYLRRRADLISPWTLFQLGCANFIGVSAIQSGSTDIHLYIVPMDKDYLSFALGGIVFYAVAILTYYYFRWPVRFANVTFRKTGSRTPSTLICLVPLCLVLTLGHLFIPRIEFIAQWIVMLGRGGAMMAVAFVMVIWAQRPFNILYLFVFVGLLGFALLAGSSDFGRRDLLAVGMTAPVCWYWLRGRYLSTPRVAAMCGIFLLAVSILITGASAVRGIRLYKDQNPFEVAWTKLSAIPKALLSPGSGDNNNLGGDTTEASLAAIRLYDGVQEPEPFHAFKYIVLHWVPRAWWPGKPVGLGETLPTDTGWRRAHRTAASLGPGVIGHGFHEGGLFFVAFYAWLFASVLRWYQTLLERDPSNPYLLGGFCACSGQLIALVRGDIGLFCAIMIGAFMSALFMNYLARIFFGTDRIPTVEEAAYAASAAAAQPEYAYPDAFPQHAEPWRI